MPIQIFLKREKCILPFFCQNFAKCEKLLKSHICTLCDRQLVIQRENDGIVVPWLSRKLVHGWLNS